MSSKQKKISRRQFLTRGTQTAAGIAAATALASCTPVQQACTRGRIRGANERINVAVIGIRSQGNYHLESYAKLPNVRVKTLCDIDANLFPERVKKVDEIQNYAPGTETDLRRVFEDKDIDAVSIANPNHWHALTTIWACQAGKHVYVEKPCAHNIFEGRKMVEAARKYNRIVQVGFQNRSIAGIRQAMKFLHDGKLGEIYMARGLCFKPRGSLGICPDGLGTGKDYEYSVWGSPGVNYDAGYMSKVNYDLWLGPAPQRAFNYNRFHYNWHWHWDYGNGDIGNQGPHQFDVARWGLNKNEHPVKIHSSGGFFGFKDSAQETANTQTATCQYADGKILQFEVRGVYTGGEADQDVKIGNLFYGSEGWMSVNGSSWKTYFGRKNEPGPSSESAKQEYDPLVLVGTGGGGHFENFIAAVRSANREDLTCDIEQGFMSSALPLMTNVSYRLGSDLTFDGDKEKFVGDKKANAMLTRKYRKPYVVPDKV